MATKTLYPLDAKVGATEYGDMQEDGSAPATAIAVTGWIVGTSAPPIFAEANVTTERSNGTFGGTSVIDAASGPNGSLGDSWRAGPFSGDFAAADWDFDWFMRSDTSGSTHDGRARMRVWKSANADGSSPTELTSATQVGATLTNVTATAQNSGMTWAPGALSLANEYLFFQLEWEGTGAGGTSTNDVHFQIGTSRILTPDFTPAAGGVTSVQARRRGLNRGLSRGVYNG